MNSAFLFVPCGEKIKKGQPNIFELSFLVAGTRVELVTSGL